MELSSGSSSNTDPAPVSASRAAPVSREASVRRDAHQDHPQRFQSHGEQRGNGSSSAQQRDAAQPIHQNPASGLPQRNLSFRERAAREDLDIPHDVKATRVDRHNPDTARGFQPTSSALPQNGSSRQRANRGRYRAMSTSQIFV